MDIPQVIFDQEAGTGSMGQEYLAAGKQVAMRRWEEGVSEFGDVRVRDYEIVGYVISGVLELEFNGQTAKCCAGNSWLVPKGAPHRYRVIEPLVAIEATSSPARFNDRDQAVQA